MKRQLNQQTRASMISAFNRTPRTLATAAVAALLLLTAGCATTSEGVKEDKQAVERSKAYMQSVSYQPSSARASASCEVPKGIEKVLSTTSGPSKEWKDLLERAHACANQKDWRKLESIGNEMARIDLDSPWGVYFVSVAAEGTGDYPRALWMLDLAQKKAGGPSGLFLYQRGRVFLAMKEVSKGMVEIEKAVALQPSLIEARLYLAQVHHRDMEWKEAEPHYRAVLAADSSHYPATAGLAEVRLQLGDGAEAAKFYEAARSLQPGQMQPWLRLGHVYESLQKNNELALNTYKGLRSKLESGAIKERLDFDLNAKIKSLEVAILASQTSRVPAQVGAQPKAAQPAAQQATKTDEQKRSVK